MKVSRLTALLLAAAVLLSLSGCIGGSTSDSGGDGPEDHGGIEFMTDYDAAKQKAVDEGKPLLIYFWADWCIWCERYHENVFPSDRVKTAADEYVRVAIDVDSDSPLVDEHGVRGPPVIVFVDPETESTFHRIGGYPSPSAVKDPANYFADQLEAASDFYAGNS